MPDCSTSAVNLPGSRNVGGERERGRERDREVGEGDGETWDIIAMTCTVATDKYYTGKCRAQKLVGNLRRGGWLDGNVGQVMDKVLFLVKNKHVGQMTNRGAASRTKKQCWSSDGQETENGGVFWNMLVR